MAAEEGKDKKSSVKPITDKQRFTYIGFEVFPGKPKDLFKTDAEKKKLVDEVLAKRDKGETLRDQCTLLEERVSLVDRLVLTVASVLIFATLFIPWYAVYNEIVEETAAAAPTEQNTVVGDSAALAQAGDTLLAMTGTEGQTAQSAGGTVEETAQQAVEGAAGQTSTPAREGVIKESNAEEVLTGYVAKKKIHKEYDRLSGIGSIVGLGTIGSYVFSSGGVLIITAIILLIYTLWCIGAPAYTLYGLYGLKGDPDQKALKLKKMLRINWVPLILFVLVLVFSFFGAEYGNNAGSLYTSLGRSYGPAAFLGSLSWGIIVSLSAFILVAVKGVEI